jgi:hypothetical protein
LHRSVRLEEADAMRTSLIASALLASVGVPAAAQQGTPAPPPWTLSEPQIREIVGRVRAGRDLSPGSWPGGARVAVTISLARALGLVYDSSLMADDRPYEVVTAGTPTGMVQLPVEWILDDAPYFNMDRFSGIRPTMNQDEVFAIWRGEFDVAYEEGGMFILTMHPHITGHRARAAMLERLIVHMKSKPGVWFATHEQIARYVKAQGGMDRK